jgi:hypothetical protein
MSSKIEIIPNNINLSNNKKKEKIKIINHNEFDISYTLNILKDSCFSIKKIKDEKVKNSNSIKSNSNLEIFIKLKNDFVFNSSKKEVLKIEFDSKLKKLCFDIPVNIIFLDSIISIEKNQFNESSQNNIEKIQNEKIQNETSKNEKIHNETYQNEKIQNEKIIEKIHLIENKHVSKFTKNSNYFFLYFISFFTILFYFFGFKNFFVLGLLALGFFIFKKKFNL